MTREEFLHKLDQLKKNNFVLPQGEYAEDYLPLMLKYIGDPDPILRDSYVHPALCTWISEHKYFDAKQLSALFDTLLGEDYTFDNFGACGDDNAVKRTFSIVILPQILDRNVGEKFLTAEQLERASKAVVRYVRGERDLREFDEKIGWVDAISHSADAMYMLAYQGLSAQTYKEFLDAERERFFEGAVFFAADEYERVTLFIYYGLMENNGVDAQSLNDWFVSLGEVNEGKTGLTRMKARTNTRNLVRSIYFQILQHDKHTEFLPVLKQVEMKINKIHYMDL